LIVTRRTPLLVCADLNGNEVAGVTSVGLEARDVSGGELSLVSILIDGELDDRGEADATLVIAQATRTVQIRGIHVTMRVWDYR